MGLSSRSVFGLVVSVGLAGAVGAQVTLPPPAPRPEMPEYVPPSQRVDEEEPAFDPSSVEFDPIWTLDEDGKVVGPDGLAEIAALRHNPLITEDLFPIIETILEDRAKEMDTKVFVYPRKAIDALTGAIDNFDVRKEDTRNVMGEIANSLNVSEGLVSWLRDQGLITEEMSMVSFNIMQDYTKRTMDQIAASMPDADQLDLISHQSRFLVRLGLQEPLSAFGRLSRKVLELHPDVVENAAELLELKGRDFLDEVAKALKPLDDDQLKALFKEAYESLHGPVVNSADTDEKIEGKPVGDR
ncbi:MAG TPA: hypothetical protein ENJ00_02390 [Phycisphaerales bacterium]|nr:hypothetical protein [Phycisphaerales bacterium]